MSGEGAGSQESVVEQAHGGVCVCMIVCACQAVSQPFRQEEAKPELFNHRGLLLSERRRERRDTCALSPT